MNFFERQHKARRKTGLLALYFVLALVLIVAAINTAVYWSLKLSGGIEPEAAPWTEQPYFAWITIGVVAVIAVGSLVSLVRLAAGGKAVAEMVGARRIDPATRDADERRLVNVVEEMSIASGTPVPALYVLDDDAAINAFVAGYRPDGAVMVITRGALATLDRDELQGVVGHEYSHILNGDMRINVRLLSVLAGIVLLGQLGEFLMRSLRHTGRGSSRNEAQVLVAALALGFALFVVGYIGLFFGRLIKAAIARQREYLADASAVQYTRNPDGIAGALWKIMNHGEGSLLTGSHAEDMSHMCFGETVTYRLSGLFATHPPLPDRIKAINPGFQARARTRKPPRPVPPGTSAVGSAAVSAAGASAFAGGAPGLALQATAAEITASVGNPTPGHVDYAQRLHASLPPALIEAAHTQAGAHALLCAMVMKETTPDAGTVARLGESGLPAPLLDRARALRRAVDSAGPQARLPLVNIAIATLKAAPAAERERVRRTIAELIAIDRKTTMFEFVLLALLNRQLDADADREDRTVHFRFDAVVDEVRILLSTLARAGGSDEVPAQAAYARVMRSFDVRSLELLPESQCNAERLAQALEELAGLSPFLKRSLINACADCVLHDGKVMPAEAELLRATAETLDCPIPPLLPPAQ